MSFLDKVKNFFFPSVKEAVAELELKVVAVEEKVEAIVEEVKTEEVSEVDSSDATPSVQEVVEEAGDEVGAEQLPDRHRHVLRVEQHGTAEGELRRVLTGGGGGEVKFTGITKNADGSITVRLYHKPLVMLIWLGAVGMAFGGALSLSDRRAESAATLLTQQFNVPAENLTSQGYGEQYLKVPTDGPERRNRRVKRRHFTVVVRQGRRAR